MSLLSSQVEGSKVSVQNILPRVSRSASDDLGDGDDVIIPHPVLHFLGLWDTVSLSKSSSHQSSTWDGLGTGPNGFHPACMHVTWETRRASPQRSNLSA